MNRPPKAIASLFPPPVTPLSTHVRIVSFALVTVCPRPYTRHQSLPQIAIFSGAEAIFRRDYAHPGLKTEAISLASPRRALLRVEMTIAPQSLVFEDHAFVGYNTRFHVALKWMIVGPMVLAALPLLWSGGGIGGSRIALPG